MGVVRLIMGRKSPPNDFFGNDTTKVRILERAQLQIQTQTRTQEVFCHGLQ